MVARIDQIKRGISMYFEEEICRKAVGPGQFFAYFALPSIPKLVEEKVKQFIESPLAADLVAEGGLVDLDTVRARAHEAMGKVGCVELMGFRLDASDIDNMYEFIRRA